MGLIFPSSAVLLQNHANSGGGERNTTLNSMKYEIFGNSNVFLFQIFHPDRPMQMWTQQPGACMIRERLSKQRVRVALPRPCRSCWKQGPRSLFWKRGVSLIMLKSYGYWWMLVLTKMRSGSAEDEWHVPDFVKFWVEGRENEKKGWKKVPKMMFKIHKNLTYFPTLRTWWGQDAPSNLVRPPCTKEGGPEGSFDLRHCMFMAAGYLQLLFSAPFQWTRDKLIMLMCKAPILIV